MTLVPGRTALMLFLFENMCVLFLQSMANVSDSRCFVFMHVAILPIEMSVCVPYGHNPPPML